MIAFLRNERRVLETMLIVVVLGMTALYFRMGVYQSVALNLFFLPIALSGYYFGRSSAGTLALLCALAISVATTLRPTGFAAFTSPIAIGLALSVWAATLGLTALLMGTLCDERARSVSELRKAYVGVVDVLSKYLQSANPRVKARSTRIAELCQRVAREMNLPSKQIDDIRVAALLHDLENVEITTTLISKAVNTLDADFAKAGKHTFLGADLVHSLSQVLESAVPLLVSQDDAARACLSGIDGPGLGDVPRGARIIAAVRIYDRLANEQAGSVDPRDTVKRLAKDSPEQDVDVLAAIERVVLRTAERSTADELGSLSVGV